MRGWTALPTYLPTYLPADKGEGTSAGSIPAHLGEACTIAQSLGVMRSMQIWDGVSTPAWMREVVFIDGVLSPLLLFLGLFVYNSAFA